jgi:hypothetical protein
MNIAKSQKNSSLCDYADTKGQKAWCQVSIGLELENYNICNEVSFNDFINYPTLDECYTKTAIASNNISYCDQVYDSISKTDCIDLVTSQSNSS